MDVFVKISVSILAFVGLVLTSSGLPGNVVIFIATFLLAWYDDFVTLNWQYLLLVFVLVLLGELWEFLVGFLGIKKEKVSWLSVFVIGLGTICFAIAGSFVLPIVGSILGGALGAFIMAFTVEYFSSKSHEKAYRLGWIAAKNQMFAIAGKIVVGLIAFILLLREIIFVM